jgi:hypothetical protein
MMRLWQKTLLRRTLPTQSLSRRPFIGGVFDRLKSALTTTGKPKIDRLKKEQYDMVDKLIDEAMPTKGIIGGLFNRVWKHLGRKAIDVMAEQSADCQKAIVMAEDIILEDKAVQKMFGKDVLVTRIIATASEPLSRKHTADDHISATVELEGNKGSGTAQIAAFKFNVTNPSHKLQRDLFKVYKIDVSDGIEEVSALFLLIILTLFILLPLWMEQNGAQLAEWRRMKQLRAV